MTRVFVYLCQMLNATCQMLHYGLHPLGQYYFNFSYRNFLRDFYWLCLLLPRAQNKRGNYPRYLYILFFSVWITGNDFAYYFTYRL